MTHILYQNGAGLMCKSKWKQMQVNLQIEKANRVNIVYFAKVNS